MAVSNGDLIVLLIVTVSIIVCVSLGVFAYSRKKKAYLLYIEKDYRNPDNPKRRYYAIVDKSTKAIRLFRGLLSFKPVKNIPYMDLNAFANRDKQVMTVQGVTGSPYDDMIVPMGYSILSQGAAMDYANKVSDGVNAGVNEIFREYQQAHPEFIYDKKEWNDRTLSYFSKKWVMQKFGIRNVENANIVTLPQKMAVASLSSRANEFIIDRAGWLEKHSGLVMGLLIMFFVVICAVILMYGASNYLNNLSNLTHTAVNTYTNLLGVSNHSAIPSVSIPKVTT